jgi:hypothetical protein
MIREFFAPRIRKWNGVMPVCMSPHQPLLFIDTAAGGK